MTWQIQDVLIYENQEHHLNDEILEYRIRKDRSLAPKVAGGYTACWRGYVATYEIRDYQLFLNDVDLIHSETGNEKDDFLNGLFEDRSNMKLDWLSCLIVLYKNQQQGEFHMPELNRYEAYEIWEIKNGNLNDTKTLNFEDYKKFTDNQYEYFLISEDYEFAKQEFIETNLKRENQEKELLPKSKRESFVFKENEFQEMIRDFPLFYTKRFY